MGTLAALYEKMTSEQREFQFGRIGADPLTEAFPRKRVVHAGIDGTPVSPAEAQHIWQRLMEKEPVGNPTQTAYIHIPFCKTKCLYCAFFQNGTDQAVEDAYVDALILDLQRESAAPRLKNGLLHSVFIGGGTPTSLSVRNAQRLLQTIRECLPLANDYELTMEGRIHDLVPEKMDAWMAGGVNRMSLGVQSFDTTVRRQVGRLDDKETVLRNLAALRAYNQCVVVIDLIYGLPGQTHEIWKADLNSLIESGVDGVDLYQLNVFDNSDLAKRIQAGALPPAATTKEQARMFAFGRSYLEARKYNRLSACHWSRTEKSAFVVKALGADHIFIGDSRPCAKDMQALSAAAQTDADIIIIPVILRDTSEKIRKLLNRIYTPRPDKAEHIIRAKESRTHAKGLFIKPLTTLPARRQRGDITVDNADFLRYAGEIQLITAPMPAEPRTNTIAAIPEEHCYLLDCLCGDKKFTFRFIE